jgi:hypothetical protein
MPRLPPELRRHVPFPVLFRAVLDEQRHELRRQAHGTPPSTRLGVVGLRPDQLPPRA